jgi:hypothetical protein
MRDGHIEFAEGWEVVSEKLRESLRAAFSSFLESSRAKSRLWSVSHRFSLLWILRESNP